MSRFSKPVIKKRLTGQRMPLSSPLTAPNHLLAGRGKPTHSGRSWPLSYKRLFFLFNVFTLPNNFDNNNLNISISLYSFKVVFSICICVTKRKIQYCIFWCFIMYRKWGQMMSSREIKDTALVLSKFSKRKKEWNRWLQMLSKKHRFANGAEPTIMCNSLFTRFSYAEHWKKSKWSGGEKRKGEI